MVIAKWKKIPKEEFEQFVRESRSIRELAGKIGYHPDGGGTARSLKEAIKFYGCDISHFLGQSWQKENYDYSQFEFGTVKKNSSSSARVLIKLRGHRCEVCGLTTWLEKPITLHIHHLDGNRINNELENLQLLCPNCHSFTDNFIGRKNKGIVKVNDEDFIQALKYSPTIHYALKQVGLNTSGTTYQRARELIQKNNIEHLMSKNESVLELSDNLA